MTNTATLNTSNKNSVKYAREKTTKTKHFLSKTSHHTNRTIIKQRPIQNNFFGEREREREREGERELQKPINE